MRRPVGLRGGGELVLRQVDAAQPDVELALERRHVARHVVDDAVVGDREALGRQLGDARERVRARPADRRRAAGRPARRSPAWPARRRPRRRRRTSCRRRSGTRSGAARGRASARPAARRRPSAASRRRSRARDRRAPAGSGPRSARSRGRRRSAVEAISRDGSIRCRAPTRCTHTCRPRVAGGERARRAGVVEVDVRQQQVLEVLDRAFRAGPARPPATAGWRPPPQSISVATSGSRKAATVSWTGSVGWTRSSGIGGMAAAR